MATDVNGSVLDRSLGPRLSSLAHADMNALAAFLGAMCQIAHY